MEKNDDCRIQGYLAEYNNIRKELTDRQNSRYFALAFIVTAIGALNGVAYSNRSGYDGIYIFGSATIFSFALIILGLLITIAHSRGIRKIGSYIQHQYSDKNIGLYWETAVQKLRDKQMAKSEFPGSTYQKVDFFSQYYFILICAVVFIFLTSPLGLAEKAINGFGSAVFFLKAISILVIILIEIIISMICCYDLYMRKGIRWSVDWGGILDNYPEDES